MQQAGGTGKLAMHDLAALCRGIHPGRGGAGEITLFKAVGTAVADLAAAVAVWDALPAG